MRHDRMQPWPYQPKGTGAAEAWSWAECSSKPLAREGFRLAEESPQTWADIIRGEAQRRGALTTADERRRWKHVLEGFSREQRTAFAAAAAESLMRSRESARPQGDYVLTWRSALDAVWRGLEGDANAFKQIASTLADFYRSPYFHDDGPDRPAEADDNAAASAYYAAECFIHGCLEFALWAAERAIDEVGEAIQWDEDRASDLRVIGPADAVRWELDPRMQEELHRHSARLDRLAKHTVGFGGSMAIRHAVITQFRDERAP